MKHANNKLTGDTMSTLKTSLKVLANLAVIGIVLVVGYFVLFAGNDEKEARQVQNKIETTQRIQLHNIQKTIADSIQLAKWAVERQEKQDEHDNFVQNVQDRQDRDDNEKINNEKNNKTCQSFVVGTKVRYSSTVGTITNITATSVEVLNTHYIDNSTGNQIALETYEIELTIFTGDIVNILTIVDTNINIVVVPVGIDTSFATN